MHFPGLIVYNSSVHINRKKIAFEIHYHWILNIYEAPPLKQLSFSERVALTWLVSFEMYIWK